MRRHAPYRLWCDAVRLGSTRSAPARARNRSRAGLARASSQSSGPRGALPDTRRDIRRRAYHAIAHVGTPCFEPAVRTQASSFRADASIARSLMSPVREHARSASRARHRTGTGDAIPRDARLEKLRAGASLARAITSSARRSRLARSSQRRRIRRTPRGSAPRMARAIARASVGSSCRESHAELLGRGVAKSAARTPRRSCARAPAQRRVPTRRCSTRWSSSTERSMCSTTRP